MGLKINLFDFLSYTIPGGLYLFEILFFLNHFFPSKIAIAQTLKVTNVAHVLLVIPICFIIGHTLDEFAKGHFKYYSKLHKWLLKWNNIRFRLRLIKKKKKHPNTKLPNSRSIIKYSKCKTIEDIVLIYVKQEYGQDFYLKMNLKQWSSYYAFLQKINLENVNEIQWMKVTHVLLRNLGLMFLISSILLLAQLVIEDFAWTSFILFFFSTIFLISSMRRAWKFLWNNYYMICTAMIAERIDSQKLIVPKLKN